MSTILLLLATSATALQGTRADLEAGRVTAVIEALAPLAERGDATSQTLALLAEAWVSLYRFDLAEPLLDRLEAAPPPPGDDLVRLAERLAEAARMGRAGALIDSALARRPDDRALLLGAARQRIGLGEPAQALGFLDRLGDAPDATAFALRGIALRARGRSEDAERALRRAVELEPTSAAAQEELGRLLEERGDLDGALRAYEAALARDGNRGASALGRARILARRGSEEADLALLRFRVIHAFEEDEKILLARAVEDPSTAAAWAALGVFYAEHRQFQRSLAPLRRALDLDPADAGAAETLARALVARGEIEEAEAIYAALRARFPSRADIPLRLAEAAEERDDAARARALLAEAVRLGGRGADAEMLRGRLAMRGGDAAGAARSFREATRRDPRCAECWLVWSLLLIEVGSAAEAEEEIRSALERDPRNAAPRLALSRLLEAAGRGADAARERRLYERDALERRY